MNLAILASIILILSPNLGTSDQHDKCQDRAGIVYRIARREGWYKAGTLPRRIHNPCSLVFTHQRGATKHHSGFAQFVSDEAGFNACQKDVETKLLRGASLKRAWEYLEEKKRERVLWLE